LPYSVLLIQHPLRGHHPYCGWQATSKSNVALLNPIFHFGGKAVQTSRLEVGSRGWAEQQCICQAVYTYSVGACVNSLSCSLTEVQKWNS